MPDERSEGEEPKFAPVCIWCNASWSDENVQAEEIYAAMGCPTCGDYSVEGNLVIRCHECKKVMYQKGFTKD